MSDIQFQYACATGVFMEFLVNGNKQKPASFLPCDTLRFPGACYRFHYGLVRNMITLKESDPCRTQPDEYHYIGCAWGLGYANGTAPMEAYFQSCSQYLPEKGDRDSVQARRHAACVDGYLASRYLGTYAENIKAHFCLDLEEYPLALEACNIKKNNNFRAFTFTENSQDEENIQYYNIGILERDYDPSIKPKNATFLPNWTENWSHAQEVNAHRAQQGDHHAGH